VDEGVLSLAATRPADPALVRGLRTVGCCQSVSATSITCCCWKCSESGTLSRCALAAGPNPQGPCQGVCQFVSATSTSCGWKRSETLSRCSLACRTASARCPPSCGGHGRCPSLWTLPASAPGWPTASWSSRSPRCPRCALRSLLLSTAACPCMQCSAGMVDACRGLRCYYFAARHCIASACNGNKYGLLCTRQRCTGRPRSCMVLQLWLHCCDRAHILYTCAHLLGQSSHAELTPFPCRCRRSPGRC